jgi:3-methyladenine DNA glycosylase/8-oxoguanine DNA glycosylase
VEHLNSGKVITLTLSQTPGGLHLRVNERLSGGETEEVSRKTWRMLRLGENFSPFLDLAQHHPTLSRCTRQGVRFLRGVTLFEDLVKALILGNSPHQWGSQRVAWVVDRLGDPLPSNPTRHAFPTPAQLLSHRYLVIEILGPQLGRNLLKVVERFQGGDEELEDRLQARHSLQEITATLNQLPSMNTCVLALTMLALGRYDYLPINPCTKQGFDHGGHPAPFGANDIRNAFEPWQPWSGLAYWLWDWSVGVPGE